MSIGVPGLNSVRNHFFLLREDDDWCTGTQFCHESYFFNCGRQTIGVPGLNSIMNHIFFIVGGRQLLYRDSFLNESYIFYAIHFYCGRMTIGVPGLVLIFWHDDRFIAGDKRLVYRDSTFSLGFSHELFLSKGVEGM